MAMWGWGGEGTFGPKRGPKTVKKSFPEITPNQLGCSNCWFLAIFSYHSAISPFVGLILQVYLMFPPHQLGPTIQS